MQANQQLDMDFSLIIPTRDRLDRLKNCLLSFFNKATRKHHNEAVLIADHDDKSIRDFSDFIIGNELNVRIILVWRSTMMIRDYNNYGAQCSLGRYVWTLNDDYQMVTDNWDSILKKRIEDFCRRNKDRIAYVMVDDNTHTFWNLHEQQGCTCPIMTRETVEAMNAAMPWQINSWGADVALYGIFKSLVKPRIVDAIADVKVLHLNRHNNSHKVDEINERVEEVSKGGVMVLKTEESMAYVNALNRAMLK